MKQFGTILKFELKNYFKNKIFVGITVFLVLLIAGVMFFPRISGMFHRDGVSESKERPVMLVFADRTEDMDVIRQSFTASFPGYDVRTGETDLTQAREQITSGDVECAFVITGPTSYEYYVDNLSMYDSKTMTADEVLQNLYRMNAMVGSGISQEDAQQILSAQITHQTKNLGKNQAQNFFYTYVMIFALYMVIMLYGQMVATNVATEKSSRAMEVLITSAKPVSMMFGKVIASCLAGLIQLVAVFGSAYLFFNMNRTYWDGSGIISSIFDMPLDLLVYMLVFFVLGFFIYAFLYGAIGSTASKLEDINTSVMPLTMLFIIAFMVVIFSMTNGSVDNLAMRICSYIPFTSPIAMFTRIAMSTVPFYEIALSICILIVSVVGVGVLSAKIYRVGVLLYGTTPKIGAVLKAVRRG